jgi:uncharacterized protein (UPF0297 family)
MLTKYTKSNPKKTKNTKNESFIMIIDRTMYNVIMPIITNVVSSNPAYCKLYSIQHYVIKFVSDMQRVDGFLRVLWFPHQ